MSGKENRPGWWEYPGQQIGLDGFDIAGAFHASTDGTTIARLLLPGRRNAIVMAQLKHWTGLDSRRIRQQIEQERREGCPILSDNHTGYYLAETELEKQLFVRSMRHRAGEILKTAAAIEAVPL